MVLPFEHYMTKYDVETRGVLHVGAHWGQEIPLYEKMGIKRVILFEPVTANYNKLLDNLGRYQAINIALGNMTGDVEINVERVNKGMSCSVLTPGTHLKHYPKIAFDDTEWVWMERLDDIEFDRSAFNILVADVQGYELEVLKGGEETLKEIDVVYTEINVEEVYEGCVQLPELDKWLGDRGFERKELKMAHRSWGDALYIRCK